MSGTSIHVATLQHICEYVDTPRSLSVYLMMKYKAYAEYLNLEINIGEYDSAHSFSQDYFVTKFLSKWKGFKINGVDLKKKALEDWFSFENECSSTNSALRLALTLDLEKSMFVNGIIHSAARKVSRILGPCPSFSSLIDHCSWSNGSTYDLRLGADVADKMTSKMTVTASAFHYMSTLVGHDPGWCESINLKIDGPCSLLPSEFTIVKGNKLTTVPKTAKTDRVISIEPTANIYLQKGIGSYIRCKLKREGVNLDDQTLNKSRAKVASLANLCTIDLKSASDTISTELVKSLLPIDWYLVLDDLRSRFTRHEGKWIRTSKFSSMGNGFTFELESLIFYALVSSVNEACDGFIDSSTTVYGDDIITNDRNYNQIVEVLSQCGFTVNDKKSFRASSRFHESCGGNYFDTVDVTPAYQKNASDKAEELIRLFNRCTRWYVRTYFEPLPYPLWNFLVQRVKSKLKKIPAIPITNEGDDGLLFELAQLGRFDANKGYKCLVYVTAVEHRDSKSEKALYAYKSSRKDPSKYTMSHDLGYATKVIPTNRYRLKTAYRYR